MAPTSYQKNGGSGDYQPIATNGTNGTSESGEGGKKKYLPWILLAILVAAAGVFWTSFHDKSDPEGAVEKAMATSSGVKLNSNGQVKLFDDISKYPSLGVLPRASAALSRKCKPESSLTY